nr:hypothetical protein [Rubidibacter lacunae]
MSRRGNFLDNTLVESFFATLRTELVYDTNALNMEEAKSEIFE